MTREEIIALAKQHGASAYTNRHYQDETYMTFSPKKLESFFHSAQQLERENIADDLEHGFVDDEGHHIQYAEAIRNRGTTVQPGCIGCKAISNRSKS